MAKEFRFRGKTLEEVQKMSITEFAALIPSRERRTLKREMPEQHKIFFKKLESGRKKLRTHCRDIIIMPSMVGKTVSVHNGKAFVDLPITDEMMGHRLGEFVGTRKRVSHGAAGIGATRSSASLSVR